jgi:hypothetical protein
MPDSVDRDLGQLPAELWPNVRLHYLPHESTFGWPPQLLGLSPFTISCQHGRLTSSVGVSPAGRVSGEVGIPRPWPCQVARQQSRLISDGLLDLTLDQPFRFR